MDSEKETHLRMVFKAHRRQRSSWKNRDHNLFEAAVFAVIGAALTWLFTSAAQKWNDFWAPMLGALGALFLWEFAWRPLRNYVWVVPEQMNLERLEQIDGLKKNHAAEIAGLEATIAEHTKQLPQFPNIDIEIEGSFRGFVPTDYRLSAEKDGLVFFLPEVRLINRDDVDFILELSLLALRGEGAWVEFDGDKRPHPHVERVRSEGGAAIGNHIPGLVDVAARKSVVGYVTFTVQRDHMEMFGITKDAATVLGYQVKVRDRVSGAEKLFRIPGVSPTRLEVPPATPDNAAPPVDE